MKKLFYAVTGAVFLGLTAPVIGATGEAWAEEAIGRMCWFQKDTGMENRAGMR